jgi:hypothetical protein
MTVASWNDTARCEPVAEAWPETVEELSGFFRALLRR